MIYGCMVARSELFGAVLGWARVAVPVRVLPWLSSVLDGGVGSADPQARLAASAPHDTDVE